jgi:hypothetical protein
VILPTKTLAATLWLGIAIAGSAIAAEPAPEPVEDPIGKYVWVDTATVVDTDAASGILEVEEPKGDATYLVDDATLIRKGGDTLTLRGLRAGDRIAISAHAGPDVGDPPVADTITVVIEGSASD